MCAVVDVSVSNNANVNDILFDSMCNYITKIILTNNLLIIC